MKINLDKLNGMDDASLALVLKQAQDPASCKAQGVDQVTALQVISICYGIMARRLRDKTDPAPAVMPYALGNMLKSMAPDPKPIEIPKARIDANIALLSGQHVPVAPRVVTKTVNGRDAYGTAATGIKAHSEYEYSLHINGTFVRKISSKEVDDVAHQCLGDKEWTRRRFGDNEKGKGFGYHPLRKLAVRCAVGESAMKEFTAPDGKTKVALVAKKIAG